MNYNNFMIFNTVLFTANRQKNSTLSYPRQNEEEKKEKENKNE